MSTLKVAAINNPSAASGGLAISASGNVTGAGLDLITTQSFSAVSSVSVNNCFTATYDNYRIVLSGTASGNSTLLMRYRVSGTDNSSATYIWQYMYASQTTLGASRTTSATSLQIGFTNNYAVSGLMVDLYGPYLSAFTGSLSQSLYHYSSSGCDVVFNSGGFGATTSFDGFSIFPNTGTITGTVRVYGYRN